MKKFALIPIILLTLIFDMNAQTKRLRDYGIEIGVLKTGPLNAITDVKGVKVGHTTLVEGKDIRTGVTAILPHESNIYQNKLPAAIYIGNGFGKLMGYSQVKELGNIETPIILTNTLSVPIAANALISYTLVQDGNENVRSVNPIIGETNDGYLNNIRARKIEEHHVIEAINNAQSGRVSEGNVGAGTGTSCFGYKGGIGTSSRILPKNQGGYTVGVLVQSNFGGVFQLNGLPVAKILKQYPTQYQYDSDGSCMIIVLTDAPLDARNLERLAKRAMMGLAKTGGIASNGSGDYVIAVSTAEENYIPHHSDQKLQNHHYLRNDEVSGLFLAVIEATEEAILNSLFAAEPMKGHQDHVREQLPIDQIIRLLDQKGMIKK